MPLSNMNEKGFLLKTLIFYKNKSGFFSGIEKDLYIPNSNYIIYLISNKYPAFMSMSFESL